MCETARPGSSSRWCCSEGRSDEPSYEATSGEDGESGVSRVDPGESSEDAFHEEAKRDCGEGRRSRA